MRVLDDSMLTADQALRLVGDSPVKARQALASGRDWDEDQLAELQHIATADQTTPGIGGAGASLSARPASPAWSALAWEAEEPTSPTPKKRWGKKTKVPSPDLLSVSSLEASETPTHALTPELAVRDEKAWPSKGRVVAAISVAALAAVAAGAGAWWMITAPTSRVEATPSSAASENVVEDTTRAAAAPAAGRVLQSGAGSWLCGATGAPGVTCWGAGPDQAVVAPTSITGLEDVTIDQLAVGRGFAIATDTSGGVWAWGDDDRGQLGPGAAPTDTMTAIHMGDLPTPASAVIVGVEHACALTDGTVYCFGGNRFGQVTGTPTTDPQPLTQVPDVTGAQTIGTSGYDTFATTDQGVWAWGSNQWGQADPATPGTSTPPHLNTNQ